VRNYLNFHKCQFKSRLPVCGCSSIVWGGGEEYFNKDFKNYCILRYSRQFISKALKLKRENSGNTWTTHKEWWGTLSLKYRSLSYENTLNLRIVIIWVMTPCSLVGGYQRSSKMLVTTYKTTQHHNPQSHNPHFHCCENLKAHIDWMWHE
jgi:hypothetical protein